MQIFDLGGNRGFEIFAETQFCDFGGKRGFAILAKICKIENQTLDILDISAYTIPIKPQFIWRVTFCFCFKYQEVHNWGLYILLLYDKTQTKFN